MLFSSDINSKFSYSTKMRIDLGYTHSRVELSINGQKVYIEILFTMSYNLLSKLIFS